MYLAEIQTSPRSIVKGRISKRVMVVCSLAFMTLLKFV